MNKDTHRFSKVAVLLVVVVISAIGLGAWKVLDSTSKNSSSGNTNQDNESSQTNPDDTKTAGESYFNFDLPDGWGELVCDTDEGKAVLLSPNDDPAKDCDDRTNTVLIIKGATAETCLTKKEIAEIGSFKPIKGYSCKATTYSGVPVLITYGDFGGGQSVSYSFGDGKAVSVTYYATSSQKLPQDKTVESIAKSIKF